MRRIKALFISGLLVLMLSFCSTLTPHENFKAHMEFNVGSSIDKPREPSIALPKYLLGFRVLPHGNTENEYRHVRACRYFFEFNPETRIIVGWRFEGSDKDCVIVP